MSLKKSLTWMGLSQIVCFVIQLSSSIVIARWLSPFEMGIFAIAGALVGIISLVGSFGLQALLIREPVLTLDLIATVFTLNSIVLIIISIITVSASHGAGVLFVDQGVGNILLLLSVVPLLSIPTFVPKSILERYHRFKEIAIIELTTSALTNVIAASLAIAGFSYRSLVYAQITGAALQCVVIVFVAREHTHWRLSISAWRHVSSFGAQMLAIAGITALSDRASEFLIGRLLGISELGIYNRAANINGLIWSNIHLFCGRVMLANYAAIRRTGGSLRHQYLLTVQIATAVLWPALAGLALIAKPFVVAVYGQRWSPAGDLIIILATASIINTASTMTWELFAATGHIKAQARIEFLRVMPVMLLTFVACTVSLEAAASVRIIDASIGFVIYRTYISRMTDTSLGDFRPIFAESAGLSIIALGPTLIAMAYCGFTRDLPISILTATMFCGILFWLIALVISKHPLAAILASHSPQLVRKIIWKRS